MGTSRILVVDTTPENVESLGEILNSEFEMILALNGKEALALAEASPAPDLILLDIMLPDLSRYDVCRKLKQNPATKEIPIIFLTGRNDVLDEVAGLELGAVDYITEPFNPAIIRARVKTQIRLAGSLKEMAQRNSLLSENIRLRDDVERMFRLDLKEPLNAILNVPKRLVLDTSLTSGQIELLEIINTSAHKMLETINRSSDLYKMEQGTYKFTPVLVNLTKIVKEVFNEQAILAGGKRITCSLFINGQPAPAEGIFDVSGEEFLFSSILSNLIKNALEASPEKGNVEVMLDDSPSLSMSVRNQGIIPPQIRERLFEPATVGEEGGTSLGVYSARLMSKTLGGELSFSSSESETTTFAVTLPRRDTPPTPEAPAWEAIPQEIQSPVAEKKKGDKQILVVDDYPFMRRLIMDILRQDGFVHFFEAPEGNTAITLLEKNPIDLVLSDWYMLGKSGLELLEFMQQQEHLRNIPFIMVTANLSLSEFEKAAALGLRNYITKPFSPDILRKKVEAVLEKSREYVGAT